MGKRDSLPRVTIAIPTYNRAGSYLPLALRSALAQNYPALDVLVSDNASADQTPALVRSFSDPRLRYSRHPVNIGANANYNYCLERARGDYFLLLHDDDLIDPDFVATCMEAAQGRTEAGLIRTGIRIIDEHGALLRETKNEVAGLSLADFFQAWFAGKTSWYLANTLFHTRMLREAGGFYSKHQCTEDGFAIARLAARSRRVDVEAVKASFRVHAGEETFAAKATEWGEDYLALLDCLCQLVPPEDRLRVHKEGMRFFSRLTYNRVAHIKDARKRFKANVEVFRLFHWRYLPTHRMASVKFFRRALDHARRRGMQVLSHG